MAGQTVGGCKPKEAQPTFLKREPQGLRSSPRGPSYPLLVSRSVPALGASLAIPSLQLGGRKKKRRRRKKASFSAADIPIFNAGNSVQRCSASVPSQKGSRAEVRGAARLLPRAGHSLAGLPPSQRSCSLPSHASVPPPLLPGGAGIYGVWETGDRNAVARLTHRLAAAKRTPRKQQQTTAA